MTGWLEFLLFLLVVFLPGLIVTVRAMFHVERRRGRRSR